MSGVSSLSPKEASSHQHLCFFLPGSRAGHSSTRRMSVLAWHTHILPLLVIETSLPNAQPISGAGMTSSVSPLQSGGKGELSPAEQVTLPTTIDRGEDKFHLGPKDRPHVHPEVHNRTRKWIAAEAPEQEVEVSGAHLAGQPAARLLRPSLASGCWCSVRSFRPSVRPSSTFAVGHPSTPADTFTFCVQKILQISHMFICANSINIYTHTYIIHNKHRCTKNVESNRNVHARTPGVRRTTPRPITLHECVKKTR